MVCSMMRLGPKLGQHLARLDDDPVISVCCSRDSSFLVMLLCDPFEC